MLCSATVGALSSVALYAEPLPWSHCAAMRGEWREGDMVVWELSGTFFSVNKHLSRLFKCLFFKESHYNNLDICEV